MTDRSDSWHEVWECPRCGAQFAIGHGTAVLSGPMKCSSFGHEPVECEQKLVQAFPLTEREAFGA